MGTATSAEIADSRPILLLPLGAWEQHGPHLPLDTDTIIITRVVADVLRHEDLRTVNVMSAPALSITASDEHHGFPGTLSTGTQALKDSVVAICRSAFWAKGVCIVNGHGGNADALAAITSALTYENITHSIWSLPSYSGSDMHAGHTETSLLLHIAPQEVRTNVIARGATHGDGLVEAMRTGGVRAVSENGIIGDASTATVSHGKAVLDLYTSSLRTHVLACHQEWNQD
jgi:mycofactocin system creatininase family protein